jgi:CRP/FNR family cyclic AMP-dependent transcriptional regulator
MATEFFKNKFHVLGASPLFIDLAPDDLNDLVTIAQNVKFGANEIVFEQGDLGKEMYIVLSGQVKINLRTKEGEEVTITHLGAGEAFGEIALFDQRERTATATTCDASEFLVIKREDFVGFLTNHSNVAIHFLSEISKRLRETDNLMKDALYSNVPSRLAEVLQKMASAYGKHTQQGLLIEARFTEHELAEIAGLPDEVVTTQLNNWQTKGIIKNSRGYITLLHPDELVH